MGRHRARRPGRRPEPRPAPRRLSAYVAFLRGINLGSRNRISMADLTRLLEGIGAKEVETYVQSGNAVFESRAGAARLERGLSAAIEQDLGLEVAVIVRTAKELAAVVGANPFASERDPKKVHVTFLAGEPDAERLAALPSRDGPDRLRAAGREVYLHCPQGYGRSKLSNAFFERTLGVVGTTRNWRTVTALNDLAAGR